MATSPFRLGDQATRCLAFRTSRIYTSIEQDQDARMVIGVICDGPVTLRALCTFLPHLPESALRLILQRLEEDGLIHGIGMRFNPTRMAYLLTGFAETLKPVLRVVALPPPVPTRTPPARLQRGRNA